MYLSQKFLAGKITEVKEGKYLYIQDDIQRKTKTIFVFYQSFTDDVKSNETQTNHIVFFFEDILLGLHLNSKFSKS